MADITVFWKEFRDLEWPKSAYDIEHPDLVEIDAFAAGCVLSHLNGSDVDMRILKSCVADLELVMPQIEKLDNAAIDYFQKLLKVCRLVVDARS